MTVRASYVIKGIIDKGAGQPKTILATSQTDLTIPLESRVMKSSGYNSLALTTDNQALLAQLQVGGVILADISIQASAPAIAPAPAPVTPSLIVVNDWPNVILQFGDYWCNEDIWGATGLTRGTYTDINGTTYEQKIGVSQQLGPNGEVSARMEWKFPTGTTEVKSYPSIIAGAKPGWYQATSPNPGGYDIILPNGSVSQSYPSGKTPNSIFPLSLPLTSLKCSVSYAHNQTPTGRGHLAYDIWLQNDPAQTHGFTAPPITTEIMIPLDYWGSPGYGSYPSRNPSWYIKDATIDGRLYHCYWAPHFNEAWEFVVYEPDVPGIQPGTIDLAAFINHAKAQGWTNSILGGATASHVVSVELGVEPVDGTGDISISNYRVYQ